MKVTVTVDGVLAERLRASIARADPVVQDALHDIGREFVAAAEDLAPGNRFAQSFDAQRQGRAVVAGSSSPMAHILEKGRRPGRRPPPASIRKRSGGSMEAAKRTADRIAASGTRGLHTVRRANTRIKRDGTIDRIARGALRRIVEGV